LTFRQPIKIGNNCKKKPHGHYQEKSWWYVFVSYFDGSKDILETQFITQQDRYCHEINIYVHLGFFSYKSIQQLFVLNINIIKLVVFILACANNFLTLIECIEHEYACLKKLKRNINGKEQEIICY
jgi:hypothetical protein